MKKIIWSILFALVMGVYALLRDFRDAFFINLVGIGSLPYAKIISLFFLIFELFVYQRIMISYGPRRSFLCAVSFYGFLSLLCGLWLYFHANLWWPLAYIFYVCAEGFPPFVWSAMWMVAVSDDSHKRSIDTSLWYSLCAQGGALMSVIGLSIIGVLVTMTENIFFSVILIIVSVLFFVTGLLFYSNTSTIDIEKQVQLDASIHDRNVVTVWLDGIKELRISRYLQGIVFVMTSWEFVNIISNYIRLSVFSEKVGAGVSFLVNLYSTTAYTYTLGFLLVMYGYVFSKKYKKTKTIYILWLFPILIFFMGVGVYFDQEKKYFIVLYMILRALYPSLIFPLKEVFFSITNNQTKFIIKTWMDTFISRFGKLIASVYITTISGSVYAFYINSILWGVITLSLFIVFYYLHKKYLLVVE